MIISNDTTRLVQWIRTDSVCPSFTGWSYALSDACASIDLRVPLDSHCLGAFDHSDLCHKVFTHNFPDVKQSVIKKATRKNKKQKVNDKKESKPVAIENLTKDYLEDAAAKLWMMSPPCQPHTRQHSNQEQDVEDPRSKSFLHLCDMISSMKSESLPKVILLENVIGFESVSLDVLYIL